MRPAFRLWIALSALTVGCFLGYYYWPAGVGLLAVLVSGSLLLPIFLLAALDTYRVRKGQRLSEFIEMNLLPPKPLFTGLLADILDQIVHFGASIWGFVLIAGGLGAIGYIFVLLGRYFFA